IHLGKPAGRAFSPYGASMLPQLEELRQLDPCGAGALARVGQSAECYLRVLCGETYPATFGSPSSHGPQGPPCLRMASRNFSRSSGVICSHLRMSFAPQNREGPCGRPCMPLQPPNSSQLRPSSPTACQNVITCMPNSGGISQFHRYSTPDPKPAIAMIRKRKIL